MTGLQEWLDARTRRAPPVLRDRVLDHVRASGGEGAGFDRLNRAGHAALRQVVAQEGDRSVALDLLAADGLITLALLLCAEHDSSHLASTARALTLDGCGA